MAKLDIPGKDYFKDPHVIASLAETVLFSCRLRIESDDVQLVDTVEAKMRKMVKSIRIGSTMSIPVLHCIWMVTKFRFCFMLNC